MLTIVLMIILFVILGCIVLYNKNEERTVFIISSLMIYATFGLIFGMIISSILTKSLVSESISEPEILTIKSVNDTLSEYNKSNNEISYNYIDDNEDERIVIVYVDYIFPKNTGSFIRQDKIPFSYYKIDIYLHE